MGMPLTSRTTSQAMHDLASPYHVVDHLDVAFRFEHIRLVNDHLSNPLHYHPLAYYCCAFVVGDRQVVLPYSEGDMLEDSTAKPYHSDVELG